MPKFEKKELRTVFGQFPTGVTVVTTVDKEDKPVGMTVSSFNTVSIDPALILWSIDKSNFSLQTFSNCEYFAVNVLAEQQVDISNKFAGRGEDKFAQTEYVSGLGNNPLLAGCVAQLECQSWQVVEGGDHLIIIGEVINFNINENQRPLLFSQGTYAKVNYDT